MSALDLLLDDLAAETRAVDGLLQTVPESDWDLPTPAQGWSVRDQVTHLAFFDDVAITAATDREEFLAERARLLALGPDFPDHVARQHATMLPDDALAWFRSSRARLTRVLRGLDPKDRMPWFGPDMSIMSCATARFMETWAHGQDLFDTFGIEREETDRIRHVAHLGVSTMRFSFGLRGLPVPETSVYVDLAGPSGARWTWGEPDAADRVVGLALDFCLVVTQRRNVADTGLWVTGPVAEQWLSIAQAYAGAPGPGRTPTLIAEEVS